MMNSIVWLVCILPLICHGKEEFDHAGASHPAHFIDGVHNANYDHEAVLGSKGLDSEFAQLSPAEAKRRLSILIQKMDMNKDNYITKDELAEWVLNSFRSLDAEEAYEKMKEHDKDGDGNVTWAEYLSVVYGYTPEEVKDFKHDKNPHVLELGEMIALDMEKFIAADENRDRILGKHEYPAFMHPYDYKHMHAVEIKRILRHYDHDKSGDISLDEFLHKNIFPHSSMRDEYEDVVDSDNFQFYDANKDGVLDSEEVKTWALPDNLEAAFDEANHLMQETDSNKDKKLSIDEIISKYELWVGSSATDYGQHLHEEL